MVNRNLKIGQQEMIGFVLKGVVVVVGLLVFLVVSLNVPTEKKSAEVENILNAIMKTTTKCAIPSVPYFDNYEDLFLDCRESSNCENLNERACYYLNESLSKLLKDVFKSEATVTGYELNFATKEEEKILRIGGCASKVSSSAQKNIESNFENLIVRLKICED
ncbi:MAG: hypothetical protein Q8N88_00490 [Nanoarchaeota archaeon]|nr:hypothetical protein [Nanoarchaeota archaeon]